MSNLYWLTEAQMERLQLYSPKSRGRARVDYRRVLSGIIFINRNCLRWCAAPAEYGPRKMLKSLKKTIKYDKRRYNRCHCIELMFSRLKDWRRVSTHYDRCPKAFLSAIALATTLISWL
jgi:transposase